MTDKEALVKRRSAVKCSHSFGKEVQIDVSYW